MNRLKKGARGVSGSPGAVWCHPPFSSQPLSSLHLEKNNKKIGQGRLSPPRNVPKAATPRAGSSSKVAQPPKKLKKKQPGHPAPRHVRGAPGHSPQPLPFMSPPCQHPETNCAHATPRTHLPGALLTIFPQIFPKSRSFSSITPSRGRPRARGAHLGGRNPCPVSPPSLPMR